ncbi:MAG TPA: YeeE/YedE thiosulfate transporter family protein [Prolixibacteraceae bacterium]|nr:YeeE/YedE thiosulfate transporter family protein [Prolixibacteraceae bacterium]
MGPLVPYIISNEFNLIIALIAGIGFGFVLEQAGFSSTKKLVGLFYGYDFTVLKVFFTAGVTAMIGILFLNHLGLLDLSLIYINPTFLWSALIGGAIMGVGFIIGGFCPGTSVCAAAIGKLDGLAFVFGGALGVLVFAEGYPLFEKIYLAEAWGPVLIYEQLSMSRILFAFILTAVAVSAFYLTSLIENRVNNHQPVMPRERMIKYSSATGLAFFLLMVVAFMPDSNQRMEASISKEFKKKDFTQAEVPADKLAGEIVNNYYRINIIDTRDAEAFKAYHLPLAINIPLDKMKEREWQNILDQKHKVNYFYADDQQTARKALLLANRLGTSENFILSESTSEFKSMFSDTIPPAPSASKLMINTFNFRRKAAADMNTMVNTFKNSSQPVVVKTSKIKGGC